MRHLAVRVADVAKAEGWLRAPVAVLPETSVDVEPILRKQAPTVGSDKVDSFQQELEDGFRDEVVEVDAHPPRLDSLAAAGDLTFELV